MTFLSNPFFIPGIIVVILSIFLVVYHSLYILPLDTAPESNENYPYYLNADPKLVSQNHNLSIFYQFLDDKAHKNLDILILDPNGNDMQYSISNSLEGTESYNQTSTPGNYSIAIISLADNKTLLGITIDVVPHSHLYSLYRFVTGVGLPITIGAIFAFITGLYNWLNTRNSERTLKLTEKSKWIISNAQSYPDVSRSSQALCNCFVLL